MSSHLHPLNPPDKNNLAAGLGSALPSLPPPEQARFFSRLQAASRPAIDASLSKIYVDTLNNYANMVYMARITGLRCRLVRLRHCKQRA
jgi:hypothetical protein